jgi:hypothetical protein
MTLHKFFPHFRGETMPEIPREWTPAHYANDACPSWETPDGLRVFVDREDKDMRECPSWQRYSVQTEEGETLLDTDDWNEVLKATQNYSV